MMRQATFCTVVFGLSAALAAGAALAHDDHSHIGTPSFVQPVDGTKVSNPVTVRFRLTDAGTGATTTSPSVNPQQHRQSHEAMAHSQGHEHQGMQHDHMDEGDGAHIHLLVDAPLPRSGEMVPVDDHHLHFMEGETETTLDLPPGRHTLQLLVGGPDHMPTNPPIVSKKITITVVAPRSKKAGS
jgi:hypothetical protein